MKYEKWSLGYAALKVYVRFAHRLAHKRIIVTGRQNLPKNKPLVLVSNHQNALCDPLAILCSLPLQPVWLTRADIFKSKFTRPILRFLKMIPVYRMRDGKESLEKNNQTFIDSAKVLENNFSLALFPEAAHTSRRQMIPHKKATPRIVFLTEEKNNFSLDIRIVPIGIYYSHYWNFNRTLIVNIGEPIRALDYTGEYQSNPQNTSFALRDRIYEAILPLTLDFRSQNFYNEFEKIREIYSRRYLERSGDKDTILNRFRAGQEIARQLDNLETTNPELAAGLAHQANSYLKLVKKSGLRDWLVDENQNKIWKLFLNILLLIAGMPVFIYGAFFNAPPFILLDQIIRKKIKDPIFRGSFFIGAVIIFFPFIYILELGVFGFLFPGILLKTTFFASLPFAGKLSFYGYTLLLKTAGRFRFLKLKHFNQDEYANLLEKKSALVKKLDENIIANSSD